MASIAVASGADVELWLTGESAWFALPGRAAEFELAESAPLEDLLDAVLADGRVFLCTQCAARRGIGPDDVIDGIEIGGAADVRRAAPARATPRPSSTDPDPPTVAILRLSRETVRRTPHIATLAPP